MSQDPTLARVRVVAFAGHSRLADTGDPVALSASIETALREVRRAVEPAPLLLVGDAAGSDRIAADTWRLLGGPVALVHPFLGGASEHDDALSVWLDGASSAAMGSHPHLDQTRWLVANTDLLIAAWSGAAAGGPGGTADAVALAVQADLPVIWIQAGREGIVRLITPDRIAEQTELAEFAAGFGAPLSDVSAETIAATLPPARAPLPPIDGPRPGFQGLLDATLWRSYVGFRRLVGGRAAPLASAASLPPPDLVGQPGFAALTAAHAAYDTHANLQAAIHRSEQLLLILLAVVATAIGASPLPKLVAVVGELVIALVALAVWWGAERAHRHERWGNARRQAEDLRIALAAWAIAIRSGPGARVFGAPPPRGPIDGARRLAWARWGLSELIDGQRDYHTRQGAVDARIAHRLEKLEKWAFVLLLVTMTILAIAFAAARGRDDPLPMGVANLTVLVGALVPVIGAAAMALEAKLGFSEHAGRSRRLVGRLAEIHAGLPTDATAAQVMAAGRAAILALREEGRMWAEGIDRRALSRGA